MAADVTSLVRDGPGGVNFWIRRPSCGFAMTSIVNRWDTSTLFLQPLTIQSAPPSPGLPSRFAVLIPAQARLALMECRLNFTSIRTKSALAH